MCIWKTVCHSLSFCCLPARASPWSPPLSTPRLWVMAHCCLHVTLRLQLAGHGHPVATVQALVLLIEHHLSFWLHLCFVEVRPKCRLSCKTSAVCTDSKIGLFWDLVSVSISPGLRGVLGWDLSVMDGAVSFLIHSHSVFEVSTHLVWSLSHQGSDCFMVEGDFRPLEFDPKEKEPVVGTLESEEHCHFKLLPDCFRLRSGQVGCAFGRPPAEIEPSSLWIGPLCDWHRLEPLSFSTLGAFLFHLSLQESCWRRHWQVCLLAKIEPQACCSYHWYDAHIWELRQGGRACVSTNTGGVCSTFAIDSGWSPLCLASACSLATKVDRIHPCRSKVSIVMTRCHPLGQPKDTSFISWLRQTLSCLWNSWQRGSSCHGTFERVQSQSDNSNHSQSIYCPILCPSGKIPLCVASARHWALGFPFLTPGV